MESIVIVAPEDYTVAKVREILARSYDVRDSTAGRLVIESEGRRFYVGLDPAVSAEFEPDQIETIRGAMANPVFFVAEFGDIDLCKKVVSLIADRPDILVDDDHGLLVTGTEFVERIRREPGWDWRVL